MECVGLNVDGQCSLYVNCWQQDDDSDDFDDDDDVFLYFYLI